MKCFTKIALLIIIFTQFFNSFPIFNSFPMVSFFNKTKITNALKSSPLVNSWETLPAYRKAFRCVLIGMLAIPQLPITKKDKDFFFIVSCVLVLFRNLEIAGATQSAQDAQKTIKDIVTTLTENKKGFQKAIKIKNLMTKDYTNRLRLTLNSLIFSKNKLALLSSEKLPELIYTEKLSILVNKLRMDNLHYQRMITYENNNRMKIFCLDNSKLIAQVHSEIEPLITKLNQINGSSTTIRRLLSTALLIYSRTNSNSTLKILAILLLISKFDYLSLIQSNLYFEFFFTILNFVNLTKNSQKLTKEDERKETKKIFSNFSLLDKSMWAEDLKNYKNVDANSINRIANIYFLTKIKKAISDEEREVKEKDCVDFQDFIHASIYEHLFCQKNCPGNSRQTCRLISSYGFLNSVNYIFSWMISDLEQNKIIYKFEETEERKRIEYKKLKGEQQIRKLCIQEEMLTLKKNIKTEQKIEDYFKKKIEDKTEEEKKILLEEIKYVILDHYQPKNHPDFKNDDPDPKKLQSFMQKSVNKKLASGQGASKKLASGLTWALKGASWILIFNFPY